MNLETIAVLVVEDSPLFRRLLRENLTAMGFTRIHEAANGRIALEKLVQERPRLVCVDLVLPDVSGYELCEYIRGQDDQELAQVPILMISTRGLMMDRAHAADVGADGYLTKPFTQQELAHQVRRVLARLPPS